MPPASGRRTELEQAIVDAEAAVAEFAGAAARGVTVTVAAAAPIRSDRSSAARISRCSASR